MKWLLAIITALAMASTTSSSPAVASELASKVATASMETQQTVVPKVVKKEGIFFFSSVKEMTLIEKVVAAKEKLTNNRIKLNKVVKALKSRVGKTPYVFAGSSPYGWDCSGMVRWAYGKLGKEIPHSATKQAHIGKRVDTPKVGDIVVFGYKGYKSFYHSAIYIGNGKVVNANRGFGGTYIQPLTDYKNSRIAYVRVLDTP